MGKKLSSEQKNKIRKEVLSSKTKYSVAKEMGISYQLVYYYTQDIPSSKPGRSEIRGKTLELLKQLLTEGYVNSIRGKGQNFRTLQKHFPMIRRSQVDGKSIYYLEDKNKKALQAMIGSKKSRIISYQDLASMSKVFNVNLKKAEKHEFLGKKRRINRRVKIGTKSKKSGILKECQTNLDEFLGRFLHSEVLQVKMIWSTNIALLSLPLCNQGETGHKQKDIR